MLANEEESIHESTPAAVDRLIRNPGRENVTKWQIRAGKVEAPRVVSTAAMERLTAVWAILGCNPAFYSKRTLAQGYRGGAM